MPHLTLLSPLRSTLIVGALAALTPLLWRSFRPAALPSHRPTPAPFYTQRRTPDNLRSGGSETYAANQSRATATDFRARCERAAAIADPANRNEAVRTALSAWAKSDPLGALEWADGSADDLRSGALSMVADVLAAQPMRAVEIGSHWMHEHPESAEEVGSILIGALVRRAAFSAALELAAAGPAKTCDAWGCTVVDAWAQRDPASALDLAEALHRQGMQGAVFAALAKGWAQSAPEQLVAYGATLPAGADRTLALQVGLDQWLLRDPAAVGAWIRQLSDPHEHDQALTAYLTRTDQVERSTSAALALADEIADPTLRFTALEHLVHELAADSSPDVARRYATTAVGLDPQQRQRLACDLNPSTSGSGVAPPREF